MRFDCERLVIVIGCVVATLLSAPARAEVARAGVPEWRPPAPLEAALIDLYCEAGQQFDADGVDAHNQCLNARLASLRADFGYNLDRLSPAERGQLSARCPAGRPEEREAYLLCVDTGLKAIRDRWAASRQLPASQDSLDEPAAATPAAAASQGRARLGPVVVVAAGTLLVCGAAAGFVWRSKSSRGKCRACGMSFEEVGDLCPACRRTAADARKKEVADRAMRAREQAEERQRQRVQEEQERLERARLEEEERCRQEELAVRRLEEEAQRREAERQRLSEPAPSEPAADVFDPLRILGVSAGASAEEIREAYEQAKLRYDEGVVSHLSDEVQQHFRAKAIAVEDAYRALTAGLEVAN